MDNKEHSIIIDTFLDTCKEFNVSVDITSPVNIYNLKVMTEMMNRIMQLEK